MGMFDGYCSNTLAGSCNQSWFRPEPGVSAGRVFYRIFSGGTYPWRFYFSNSIDGTYADGVHSHADIVCPEWELEGLRCGVCRGAEDFAEAEVSGWQELTFDGKTSKAVAPGEFFSSDPAVFSVETGEYLCLEIHFRGEKIPYLEEAIIPTFVQRDGRWMADKKTPLAFLAGCARPVKKEIAFLGDSITMGIGTPCNSYRHWASRIAEKLGGEWAFWDIGIGYGRAEDAARDGAWLFKAKQADFVSVCFGVNDILHAQPSAEDLKRDLATIVSRLKEAGCGVGVFTVPPFDMEGEAERVRREVNRWILSELSRETAYAFDVCTVLSEDASHENKARFGGHPNPEGCERLAEAFVKFAREQNLLL